MFHIHTSDHYSLLRLMVLVSFPEAGNNLLIKAAAAADTFRTLSHQITVAISKNWSVMTKRQVFMDMCFPPPVTLMHCSALLYVETCCTAVTKQHQSPSTLNTFLITAIFFVLVEVH